jgi:hypothetical protein
MDSGPPVVRVIPYDSPNEATFEVQAFESSFTGGVWAVLGEVTGDLYTDLIVGAGNGGGPVVKIYDGFTGLEVLSFAAYEESFRGGVSVAVGDFDGDRVMEVIAGAGAGGGPRVRIFDVSSEPAGGLTRRPTGVSVAEDFFAYEDTFRGGVQVAAGDTDGDGFDEVVCGTGVGGGPRVRVVDVRTGAEVLNFFEDTFRTGVQVAAGDLDGDARDDVVCGSGPGGGPRVRAVRLDGSTAADFFAFDPSSRGGVRVGTIDTNSTFFGEILAGSGDAPVVREFDAAGRRLDDLVPFDGAPGGIQIGTNRRGNGGFPTGSRFEGTAAAVDPVAGTVDVRQEFTDGFGVTVVLARPDTVIERNGEPATLADFRVGDRVVAVTVPNGTAHRIEAFGPAE